MASTLMAAAAGCYRPSTYAKGTDGTTFVASHGTVPAGTTLWARVEATGVDGGLVRVTSIADVRSADGEEVLIPEGALLIGRVVASDGVREQVVFETIEMGDTAQRIEGEVVTEGNGLANLVEGTKLQIRLRQPVPALSRVRGGLN